jgi:hypothetical protein
MNEWFQALPVAMTWSGWVDEALASDPPHPLAIPRKRHLPFALPDFRGAARILGWRWLVWR